jgi:hypothetical protein
MAEASKPSQCGGGYSEGGKQGTTPGLSLAELMSSVNGSESEGDSDAQHLSRVLRSLKRPTAKLKPKRAAPGERHGGYRFSQRNAWLVVSY